MSFQDMYQTLQQYVTHCFRKCKKIDLFVVFLENSDFYHWSKLENMSIISQGTYGDPKSTIFAYDRFNQCADYKFSKVTWNSQSVGQKNVQEN